MKLLEITNFFIFFSRLLQKNFNTKKFLCFVVLHLLILLMYGDQEYVKIKELIFKQNWPLWILINKNKLLYLSLWPSVFLGNNFDQFYLSFFYFSCTRKIFSYHIKIYLLWILNNAFYSIISKIIKKISIAIRSFAVKNY